jgi:hypothetical protein
MTRRRSRRCSVMWKTTVKMLYLASAVVCARAADDDLVPLDASDVAKQGAGAEYRKLYEQKLFLTRGDVARYVHLPGPLLEPEGVLSIYTNAGNRSTCHVTWTEPSARLWDCIATGEEKIVGRVLRDPNTIFVRRHDAEMPQSTCRKVHAAWLAMLQHVARDPCADCSADGTTEIFSAAANNGSMLIAQLPPRIAPATGELLRLAEALVNYCQKPEHRIDLLKEIDERADRLRRLR